ncbi:class I lanthipeptide [Taibaiella koreensis]|uniref:class I lanthipeptide n=1 Tax=Taibaiella koreensis TaxID=1268548 RepID=UPI000E59E8A2|nr:class I lanthipeptide [Taibaiella koreensis]
MKKKNLSLKKLSLNKSMIGSLNSQQQQAMVGGATESYAIAQNCLCWEPTPSFLCLTADPQQATCQIEWCIVGTNASCKAGPGCAEATAFCVLTTPPRC